MDSKAPSAESGLREELVQPCKVLYAVKAAGDGLGGHLSARLDDERILIKPRPVSWRSLKPEDLIVIDFEDKRVDGSRRDCPARAAGPRMTRNPDGKAGQSVEGRQA